MQQALKQQGMQNSTEKEIARLKQQFLQSADFIAKAIPWETNEQAIICYYSSIVRKSDIEQYLNLFKLDNKREQFEQSKANQPNSNNQNISNDQNQDENKQQNQEDKNNPASADAQNQSDNRMKMNANKNIQNSNKTEQEQPTSVLAENSISISIIEEQYDPKKIVQYVCNGETLIILLQKNEMIRLISPEFAQRTTEEPVNEQVLRGSHEGLIENFDANVSLIRKRIKNNKLVVKKVVIGKETNTEAYYFYVDNLVDKDALKVVEERLNSMNLDKYYSIGQLVDQLDDSVMSPFPQLLNTERPDRVMANILEGKIAIMADNSPTAIIGPVSFFSFYQTPDDFNSRVLIGSFYSFIRFFSIVLAIYLPSFYLRMRRILHYRI